MKAIKTSAGINLLILLMYTLVISLYSGDNALVILFALLVLVGIHVAVNVVLAIVFFVRGEKPRGKAFLLSALIVLVVGFSSCWGSAMFIEDNIF